MRQISRAGILWGARPFSCAPVLVPQGDAKLVLRLFEVEDPGAVFKGQLEPEEGFGVHFGVLDCLGKQPAYVRLPVLGEGSLGSRLVSVQLAHIAVDALPQRGAHVEEVGPPGVEV